MSDDREGGRKGPMEPEDLRGDSEGAVGGALGADDTTVGDADMDDTTADVFEANRMARATGEAGEPDQDLDDVMPEELQADGRGVPLDGRTTDEPY